MKTVNIPTTILIDEAISYEAKGVYAYIYSRNKFNGTANIKLVDNLKFKKAIKELIKNKYIEIKYNNVFFIK